MKHSKTKKSSLILLLLSMFFGVIFGMALLFTPKTADAYVRPKITGPKMGVHAEGTAWIYCCAKTSEWKCDGIACN